MSERLDDLARSLAEPVPRRRALRLIGSAVAAAVLAVRAGPTAARPTRGNDGCGDSAVACGGSSLDCYRPGIDTCCPYPAAPQPAGLRRLLRHPERRVLLGHVRRVLDRQRLVCQPRATCAAATPAAPARRLISAASTRRAWASAVRPTRPAAPVGAVTTPFVCVEGRCERPRQCERGETQCGTTCCKNATQFCANAATSTCCQTGQRACTYVQPGSGERITRCCRSGTTCCVPRGGTAPGVCCPTGRCCGGQCCRPNQKCRRGRCCTKCGDKGACCARGEKCCGDRCCKSGETCGIWGSRAGPLVPLLQDDVVPGDRQLEAVLLPEQDRSLPPEDRPARRQPGLLPAEACDREPGRRDRLLPRRDGRPPGEVRRGRRRPGRMLPGGAGLRLGRRHDVLSDAGRPEPRVLLRCLRRRAVRRPELRRLRGPVR